MREMKVCLPLRTTASATAARARGFSLIELMIVMVIVGIATAAISLAIAPDPAHELRRDANELVRRFAIAQNEVRADGRVIAWQADSDGYRFSRGTWQPVPGSAIPVVSTLGALDTFARDDMLGRAAWRTGPVEVTPAGPVLLTSEAIGTRWQLVLRHGGATVTVLRDAAGGYEVR
ncbi:general secretion pathway protein H [Variovorax sp. W2I14]